VKTLKCIAIVTFAFAAGVLTQFACQHNAVTPPDDNPPPPNDTTDVIDTIPVYDEPCVPLPLDDTVQGKILFTSRREGDHAQLFVMNPDGSDIQQLTFGDYSSTSGRWSKDGTKIVFRSDSIRTTLGQGLYVMNADGSGMRGIRSPEFSTRLPLIGTQPDWAPDGERIVYLGCFNCDPFPEHHLFIVNIDGTGLQRIDHTEEVPVGGVEPSWSPDGTKIAFSGGGEIYIINANGANLRRLGLSRPTSGIAWSPDGCKISFFSSAETNRWGELFVFDLRTKTVSQITTHNTNENFLRPRWSPDGQKLVFYSSTTDGTNRKFIYTVNLDGTGLKRILDDPTASSPDWSWSEPGNE